MSVISRALMALTSELFFFGKRTFQFKNAINSLASDAFFPTPINPAKAIIIFEEILEKIAHVKDYPPKKPRPSNPRVCKKPLNKWNQKKRKRSEGEKV